VQVAREKKSFSPEFRETAAREVVENSRSIASVAREIGVHDTTLGNWVKAYRKQHEADAAPMGLSERARLLEAEREVRELRQKVAFLEKVAAYFASEPR
jgi:transposase-like protein